MKSQKKKATEHGPKADAEPKKAGPDEPAKKKSEAGDEKREPQTKPSKKDKAAGLAEELEEAKNECQRQHDKYVRLMAEFDNHKKRTQTEISQVIRTANEELITRLLEVVDNFDRAFENNGDQEKDPAAFLKGMELIRERFLAILKDHGLESFPALGKEFDPELHDALMQIQSPDVPENHVAQEIQKGYRLKDKVIRHTKVVVSTGISEAGAGEDPPESEGEPGPENETDVEQNETTGEAPQ